MLDACVYKIHFNKDICKSCLPIVTQYSNTQLHVKKYRDNHIETSVLFFFY